MIRIFSIGLLLLSTQAVLAEDLTVNATSDSYVSENASNSNFGSNSSVLIGSFSSSGSMQCALVQFDVSDIPSGSTINSASLLFRNVGGDATGSFAVAISRRNSSWSEGSVTWSNSSIQFDQLIGSCAINADLNFPLCLSSAVTTIVDQWVNQGISNTGFSFCPGIQNGKTLSLSSREGLQSPRLTVNFTPPVVTPPSPASISYPSSSSTGNFTVNWSGVSGATSYELARSNNSGSTWSTIFSGDATSRNESLGNGNYRYRARACNSAGCSGWRTGAFDIVVSIPDPIPLTPASINYPSSSSTGNFTVSWSSVSGATSYELARSSNSGSTWSTILNGNTTSRSESLGNGNYRYRVRACNSSGCSNWRTGAFDVIVNVTDEIFSDRFGT